MKFGHSKKHQVCMYRYKEYMRMGQHYCIQSILTERNRFIYHINISPTPISMGSIYIKSWPFKFDTNSNFKFNLWLSPSTLVALSPIACQIRKGARAGEAETRGCSNQTPKSIIKAGKKDESRSDRRHRQREYRESMKKGLCRDDATPGSQALKEEQQRIESVH